MQYNSHSFFKLCFLPFPPLLSFLPSTVRTLLASELEANLIGNVNTGFQWQILAKQCHIVKVTDFLHSSPPCCVSVDYCLASCTCRKFYCSTNYTSTELSSWQLVIYSLEYLHRVCRLTQAIWNQLVCKRAPGSPPTQLRRAQSTYLIQMDGVIFSVRPAFHMSGTCSEATANWPRLLDGQYPQKVGVWK